MGHRRLGGFIQEAQIEGAPFLRIDTHRWDDITTQYYAPGSVYALTPTDEATARAMAEEVRYEPIHPWELRRALESPATDQAEDEEPEFPTYVGWDGLEHAEF